MMNDLEMMKDPNRWPLWPRLPLKHRTERQLLGLPRHAVLLEVGLGNNVFEFYGDTNIYMPLAGKTPDVSGGVEMMEQLVELGWIVD